jgi:hypothetical protein
MARGAIPVGRRSIFSFAAAKEIKPALTGPRSGRWGVE